jgi:glyoxylase-like metal-dependent hydrolase (beta-lactamase superfamily II)
MTATNISEIGNEFFLVRSKEKDLHRNIYFKKFKNNGNSVNMIFDPGTKLDGDLVLESSKKLFGGLENIDIIFLSHQDPDVSSLTPFILAGAKNSVLITSIDTFRLVSMYGIPENRVFFIENFNTEILTIKKTRHKVTFIPAYYCHFRGAMMFYDYESKILFSGDFASGLNTRNGAGPYANEESWEGIKEFHTIYMPSSLAVKETVNRIGLLNPIPDIIAPQHGDIIGRDLMIDFLTRLDELVVGIDYIKKTEPQRDQLLNCLTDFIQRVKKSYPDEWLKLREALIKPGQFTSVFKIQMDAVTEIKIDPIDALRHLLLAIESTTEPSLINRIKNMLHFELESHNVLVPSSILSKLATAEEKPGTAIPGEVFQ